MWFISLIFPVGSETLIMSPFPTRGRRGQAERGERMEQEGNGKRKGRQQLQSIDDNEGEGGWGAEWVVGRKREGESTKMDRLSVCLS